MKNLIYISTAVNLMNNDELLTLLKTAREKNKKNEVTGLLLYSGGTFIQLLEGQAADVDGIYAAIMRDHRHKNITRLIEGAIEERSFPDWSMGFSSVSAEAVKGLEFFKLNRPPHKQRRQRHSHQHFKNLYTYKPAYRIGLMITA